MASFLVAYAMLLHVYLRRIALRLIAAAAAPTLFMGDDDDPGELAVTTLVLLAFTALPAGDLTPSCWSGIG
jgi:hypothetical protein